MPLDRTAALEEFLPEVPAIASGLRGTAARSMEGALYSAFDPEEGPGLFTVGERLRQTGIGAAGRAIMHPAVEVA